MLFCITWLASSVFAWKALGWMKNTKNERNLCSGILYTLKSRAKGCKWGSDHSCLLGAFRAQNWSWYQAKTWPLKAFSIRGESGKSKGPFSLWVSFPVPVSHSLLDESLWGHFLHHGSDLSFERLRSPSKMLCVAYDWEAVCKGPWHPGGMAAGLKDLKRHEKSERHVPVAYLEKNDPCFVWEPVILIINLTTTGVGWKENVGLRRTQTNAWILVCD